MSEIYERLLYYRDHTPEHKAFTYRVGDRYESVDYRTLYRYVNSLSAELTGYKNKTIAIIGNNKLEYAVSLLAVICNIGNAFLIDKELSQGDMERIFGKKKPDLIILDDDLKLSFGNYPVLSFEDAGKRMREERVYEKDPTFSGNLILHTSGTTGEPKCVLLDEKHYYGVIPELNRKWGVTWEQSCLFIIPLYHIYALTSLFHGLYAGINNILEWDYKRLGKVLSETGPHLFMGVPLMYNRIMDAALEKAGVKLKWAVFFSNLLLKFGIDVRKKWFRSIYQYFGGNYVFGISAGSLLPYKTSSFFNDIGLPIYNVYGMTETSGPIAINYRGHNLYDSVGEILDINEVVIRDGDENGTGQILVKGSNVFTGYLNDEDHASFDGEYFDTGDLGYIKNRHLYVIGRRKGILIGANGKNIAPEELNRRLLECHQIHDCNVIMEENKLIAIVNTDLSEEQLKRYIDEVNEKMPNYKRISGFRITEKKIK